MKILINMPAIGEALIAKYIHWASRIVSNRSLRLSQRYFSVSKFSK